MKRCSHSKATLIPVVLNINLINVSMNCQIMFSFPFIQFLTTYSIKRHLSVEMQIAVA